MGSQPSVFISCVSPEFRSTRQRIANILTRLGYTPVFQEIFGTESGDLREALRQKIDACHGLIQIVGKAYGAAPPEPDADFGWVSYTQYEFLHARKRGKKTWLIFAGEGCSTDTPVDQLDLPHDASVDAAAYQAKRRELQAAFVRSHQADGHLYHPAASTDALELAVERLRDDFQQMREDFERWQTDVDSQLRSIGSDVQQIKSISSADRQITTEKIRGQLLKSANEAYTRNLAHADKARGWQDRQKLKDAAKQEQDARLSRINDLANTFAELEGTAQASNVMNEMTRILKEEGADESIAYVVSRKPDILSTVKARVKAAQEKNRDDLRPLLHSSKLQIDQSRLPQAIETIHQILSIEPDWTEALHVKHLCQIAMGANSKLYETLPAARAHFEGALNACDRLLQLEPKNSNWQRELSVALLNVGELEFTQGNFARALNCYQQALAIRQNLVAADPTNSEAQWDLVYCLLKVGWVQIRQNDLAGGLTTFQKGLEISKKLAEADSNNLQAQRALADCLDAVGRAKQDLGDLAGMMDSWQDQLPIRKTLAAADPDTYQAMHDLYWGLGRISEGQRLQGDLAGALITFLQGLELAEKMVATDPGNTWAHRNVFATLQQIGIVQSLQGDFAGALITYHKGLEIIRKLAAADPSNEYREQRLWWTNAALAETYEKLSEPGQAMQYWIQARDTMLGMKSKGTFVSKEDQDYLTEIEQKLEDGLAPK